jgi:hypothetical protein
LVNDFPELAVDPVPLKLTVRGRLPVVTDGTFDATTPFAMIGVPDNCKIAVFNPAADGIANAESNVLFANPNTAHPDAPGTEYELSTTVAVPADGSYGTPVIGVFGAGGAVVPVVITKFNGVITQLDPKLTPDGDP